MKFLSALLGRYVIFNFHRQLICFLGKTNLSCACLLVREAALLHLLRTRSLVYFWLKNFLLKYNYTIPMSVIIQIPFSRIVKKQNKPLIKISSNVLTILRFSINSLVTVTFVPAVVTGCTSRRDNSHSPVPTHAFGTKKKNLNLFST